MLLLKRRVPPLFTVVPPAVVPKAVAVVALKIPLLIVVAPEYVLAPLTVHVPVPFFVTAPVPLMILVLVVELLFPPVISCPAPKTIFPDPATEPTVSVIPFKLKRPSAASVTAAVLAITSFCKF